MTVGPAYPARALYEASSEYADASWTCLSIVTLECTLSAKRFLSTQSLALILTKSQSDYERKYN